MAHGALAGGCWLTVSVGPVCVCRDYGMGPSMFDEVSVDSIGWAHGVYAKTMEWAH